MAVPGLDRDGAAGVLERAGSAGQGSLRQIAAHLRGHPDPLRTHRQDIPPGLIRLAWRLHAEGHGWVIPPRCAGCGKITAALNSVSPAGRICVTCKARARRTECARCGRIAAPAARRPDGLICGTCYDQEPARIQPCGQCGQPARIAGRGADGNAAVPPLPAAASSHLPLLRRRPARRRDHRRRAGLPPLLPRPDSGPAEAAARSGP